MVDPPAMAGTAAPLNTLLRATRPVTVTIGGVKAEVQFAGVAPGTSGLYQVNVTVPPGVPAGSAVTVVLSVDGQASPPVTMAVK